MRTLPVLVDVVGWDFSSLLISDTTVLVHELESQGHVKTKLVNVSVVVWLLSMVLAEIATSKRAAAISNFIVARVLKEEEAMHDRQERFHLRSNRILDVQDPDGRHHECDSLLDAAPSAVGNGIRSARII